MGRLDRFVRLAEAGHSPARESDVSIVKRAVAESGISPEWLELEVTEGWLMEDVEGAARKLSELRETETWRRQRAWVKNCQGCWAECEILPNAVYGGGIARSLR